LGAGQGDIRVVALTRVFKSVVRYAGGRFAVWCDFVAPIDHENPGERGLCLFAPLRGG
jgi:hypothetical protein